MLMRRPLFTRRSAMAEAAALQNTTVSVGRR
jgi:hypothetical protein